MQSMPHSTRWEKPVHRPSPSSTASGCTNPSMPLSPTYPSVPGPPPSPLTPPPLSPAAANSTLPPMPPSTSVSPEPRSQPSPASPTGPRSPSLRRAESEQSTRFSISAPLPSSPHPASRDIATTIAQADEPSQLQV